MNNTGAILHWLHSNPDVIMIIGILFLTVSIAVPAVQKGKSVLYIAGSIVTMAAVGILIGVAFAAGK